MKSQRRKQRFNRVGRRRQLERRSIIRKRGTGARSRAKGR
jgi:hypothetical protein